MNYLQIALTMYLISIPILALSVLVSLTTVLPLVSKEAKRSKKYKLLSKWFLQKNHTVIAIGTIAIFILSARFFIDGDLARTVISTLVLLFSLGFLRIALINKKIWHQEYRL